MTSSHGGPKAIWTFQRRSSRMTRQALGKGLSALLKNRQELSENEQRDLPIGLLKPNRFQPRQSFSEQRLEELAESIRQHGFVQPIIVRKSGDDFQIIAG